MQNAKCKIRTDIYYSNKNETGRDAAGSDLFPPLKETIRSYLNNGIATNIL